MKTSNSITQLATLVTILLSFVTHTATASYEPDKTPENVQKKAVIIKHDAQLFKSPSRGRGEDTKFMQIYFMMAPAKKRRHSRYRRRSGRSTTARRVPVSKHPYQTGQPDGWLDKDSFVEWNTLQMIKLEPQSGRELANIFENRHCADLFGKYGRVYSGCRVLGEEPNRFRSHSDFQLLIPVFKKIRKSYQGGFIRVYQKDNTISAAPVKNAPRSKIGRIGYDIVLVVDSTSSMGRYFVQTTEALQAFIKQIQQSVNDTDQQTPLRIGVLFYQGREDRTSSCRLDYLTQWGEHLTSDIDNVINALAAEKKAACQRENKHSAVLDGLNRVLHETIWKNNHFKSIILVGNTPPYPVYDRKNPMRLSVYQTNKIARQKNIRILTFKLGRDDKAFKRLALDTVATNQGRYHNIPLSTKKNKTVTFKDQLLNVMTEEWQMLAIAQNMVDFQTDKSSARQSKQSDLLKDPTFRQKYHLTKYEALIIRARLPKTGSTNAVEAPEFVKGWIPEEIKTQLAVGEFIFMDKFSLTKLTNALGNLAQATLIGQQEGGMAFLRTVRNVLAAQTRVPANRLFRSGESLAGSLQKANILPFRTDILTFTAQEVNTWKPQDYIRINTILKEKVKVLGEFLANPRNIHYFGNTPHLYVPRAFFP